MPGYNYAEFSPSDYNLNSFLGPKPGRKAPDFMLEDAKGVNASLLGSELN